MKKVLIIDDDTANREVFAEILHEAGYETITFNECLPIDSIVEFNPSLILLDHHLLGKNGGDFCLELKQNPVSKHIPVLMVSAGLGLKEISEKDLADGYLEKPFDLNDLEDIVKKLAL